MTALLLSLAYLVGALPLGYWLARRRGVDLRTASPYTLGLESALRRLGLGLLLLSFLLDFLKGYLPLLLGRALGLDLAGLLALGVAVYLGHLYPLFFRDPWPLRAKGAGVLLGILSGLPLPPALGLVPVALGLVLYALTGYASWPPWGFPWGFWGRRFSGVRPCGKAFRPRPLPPRPLALQGEPGAGPRGHGTQARRPPAPPLGETGGLRLPHPPPHRGGLLAEPPLPLAQAPGAPGPPEAGVDRAPRRALPPHEGGGGAGGADGGRAGGPMPPDLRPLLPHQIKAKPELAVRRAIQGARLAKELGATVVGLGAFWSVVGEKGKRVQEAVPGIEVTNGGAYTAGTVRAAIPKILAHFAQSGKDLKGATAAVVGANGVVAFGIARQIAPLVGRLILVGRDLERLKRAAESLRKNLERKGRPPRSWPPRRSPPYGRPTWSSPPPATPIR